jgi:GGDEF domain-containing protein
MSDALEGAVALNILETLPVGVLIVEAGRIQWVNAALCDMFHSTRSELTGLTVQDASSTRFASLFDDLDRLSMTGPGGTTRWLERRRLALADPSVTVDSFADITARVKLEKECKQLRGRIAALETKDPVTGLLNKKSIMQVLEMQVSRSRRYHNPLSLLLLSVQSPTDSAELHETLRGIGQALTDQLRWADQLGMLDPTSFLIILPETSLTDAEVLAAHLLENRIHLLKTAFAATVLLGAAAWQKGDDPRKLLQRLQDNQKTCSVAMQP